MGISVGQFQSVQHSGDMPAATAVYGLAGWLEYAAMESDVVPMAESRTVGALVTKLSRSE